MRLDLASLCHSTQPPKVKPPECIPTPHYHQFITFINLCVCVYLIELGPHSLSPQTKPHPHPETSGYVIGPSGHRWTCRGRLETLSSYFRTRRWIVYPSGETKGESMTGTAGMTYLRGAKTDGKRSSSDVRDRGRK